MVQPFDHVFFFMVAAPATAAQTEELHRRAYNGAFEAFGLEVDGQPVVWDIKYYDKLQNTVRAGWAPRQGADTPGLLRGLKVPGPESRAGLPPPPIPPPPLDCCHHCCHRCRRCGYCFYHYRFHWLLPRLLTPLLTPLPRIVIETINFQQLPAFLCFLLLVFVGGGVGG